VRGGRTSRELGGRVVVVTGASAGVGRASVRELAARGARLALLARPGAGLDDALTEVESVNAEAIAIPTDVADPDAVEAAAERVEAELGPIDVWVNDAMATIFARVWDIEPDEIRRATEVTYLGAVYGTMAALKRMRPRNRGKIVQVGSALSYRAIPLQAAYCASKFALRGFTDSLRCELMAEGSDVGVTMVHLPGLNTPQFSWVRVRGIDHTPRPVPPVYQPEVAARGIAFAATHSRREVWVGGSTVGTILGNRIAPKLADLYLAATNIKAQQTDHPVAPDRRDYLFTSIDEDRGAHGAFDDEAKSRSHQLEASMRRGVLGAGTAVVLAAAIAWRARWRAR
jgi:NAD(P)-dependent dehydrogenase (short-subunit alcohol dehydrogenase family)